MRIYQTTKEVGEKDVYQESPSILLMSKYDERGKFGLDYFDLAKCRKALATEFKF